MRGKVEVGMLNYKGQYNLSDRSVKAGEYVSTLCQVSCPLSVFHVSPLLACAFLYESVQNYCLEYYFHFVYFTIATCAVIPCAAWSLMALFGAIWSSIISLAPCHVLILQHLLATLFSNILGFDCIQRS